MINPPAPEKPDLGRLRISDEKRRRRASPWVAVVALALLAGGAYATRGLWLPLLESATLPRVRVTSVDVVAAGAAAPGSLVANGYIVAQRSAALAPKLAGKLQELLVVEGTRVEAGEILARLEHADVDAQLARAEADLKEAEAEVARLGAFIEQIAHDIEEARSQLEVASAGSREAEASLKDAQQERDRQERLLADGIGQRADFDRAEAQLAMAKARISQGTAREESARRREDSLGAQHRAAEASRKAAEARVEARRADILLLQVQLEYLTIRSPFPGVVIKKNAEVGEIVSPISGGTEAKVAVVTVVDMGSLMVEADVAEAYISRVRPGMETRITVDAFPDQPYPGKVFKIVPTADRLKATVEVKVSFDSLDDKIVPEMGARVSFLESEREAVSAGAPRLFVSEAALRTEGGSAWAFVVRDGVARRRDVRAGERRQGKAEVLSGLSAGEQVVVDPAPDLKDGARVRVE